MLSTAFALPKKIQNTEENWLSQKDSGLAATKYVRYISQIPSNSMVMGILLFLVLLYHSDIFLRQSPLFLCKNQATKDAHAKQREKDRRPALRDKPLTLMITTRQRKKQAASHPTMYSNESPLSPFPWQMP